MAELDIAINPSGAVRGGNVVKQIMRDIKDAASGAQGSMVNLGATFGRVLGTGPGLLATGMGALAIGMAAAGRSTANYVNELQKMAFQSNLTMQQAQMLAGVASRSGVDVNTLSGGVSKLNQQLQDAAHGSGEAQRLFGAVGISFKTSNGQVRDTGDVFQELIGRLSDFKDGAAKTTVISKLMGDELQSMARMSKRELQSLTEEAKKGILSQDDIQNAQDYTKHMNELGDSMSRLRNKIGSEALPAMVALSMQLEDMAKDTLHGQAGSFIEKRLAEVSAGWERAKLLGKSVFGQGPDDFDAAWKAAQERGFQRFEDRKKRFSGPLGSSAGPLDLVMPPDPAVLRRILEERTKQQADATTREVDLFNSGMDKEIAAMKRAMASREDMSTTTMDLIHAEHQNKMSALVNEEQKIRTLIELENSRFSQSQKIGGVSPEERDFQALQHQGALAELEGKLRGATQKTGIQAKLFDAEEFDAEARLQTEMGQRIQDSLTSTFQIGEDLRHREQDQTIKHFESLARFQEVYGTSRENELRTQYDMVRANLAKELDVNFDTAAKVLDAWRNSDHDRAEALLEGTRLTTEQIEAIWMDSMARQREVSEKFSDDFFTGFAKSMKRYVDDNSMLGLGVDQARRVAQGMEQAFGRFFFDGMEGRVQSLKDVLDGLLDFTKQILSQIAGQLITTAILRGVMGGFGGGAGSATGVDVGGFTLRRHGGIASFASGGIAHRPMLRWAGGGLNQIAEGTGSEAYVPLPDGNRIPVAIKLNGPVGMPQMMSERPQVSLSIPVNVHNSTNANVEVRQGQAGPDGLKSIEIFIDQAVQKSISRGNFDQTMLARYGQKPSLARR